jgi:mycofactocin precursor
MSSYHNVNRPNQARTARLTSLDRVHVDVPLDDADYASTRADSTAELVAEETLVEEVSIDGMCGVY